MAQAALWQGEGPPRLDLYLDTLDHGTLEPELASQYNTWRWCRLLDLLPTSMSVPWLRTSWLSLLQSTHLEVSPPCTASQSHLTGALWPLATATSAWSSAVPASNLRLGVEDGRHLNTWTILSWPATASNFPSGLKLTASMASPRL